MKDRSCRPTRKRVGHPGLLDPFIVPYLPDPGVYLAYGSGSSWNLLFPNGEEGSFQGKKLE